MTSDVASEPWIIYWLCLAGVRVPGFGPTKTGTGALEVAGAASTSGLGTNALHTSRKNALIALCPKIPNGPLAGGSDPGIATVMLAINCSTCSGVTAAKVRSGDVTVEIEEPLNQPLTKQTEIS